MSIINTACVLSHLCWLFEWWPDSGSRYVRYWNESCRGKIQLKLPLRPSSSIERFHTWIWARVSSRCACFSNASSSRGLGVCVFFFVDRIGTSWGRMFARLNKSESIFDLTWRSSGVSHAKDGEKLTCDPLWVIRLVPLKIGVLIHILE